jgi:hypothetical protein
MREECLAGALGDVAVPFGDAPPDQACVSLKAILPLGC